MGADILAKVERRWSKKHHELGPCLVWRDGEPTVKGAGGLYGRIYNPALKRSDAAHLVVWRRCFPDQPIPKGMTVDHLCEVTLCQRPDHLQGPVTRAENMRRRHQRAQTTAGTSSSCVSAAHLDSTRTPPPFACERPIHNTVRRLPASPYPLSVRWRLAGGLLG
jgi:hypothetical protein